MHAPHDIFDPNFLDFDRSYRLYAGEYADIECLVDEEDYKHFGQWMWNPKIDKTGKIYFRRAVSIYDQNGKREGSRTVYLHVEVLTRAQGPAPTRLRRIADHWNGNSLDNRHQNLRWTTKGENNRNRFGVAWAQRTLLLNG